MENFISNKVKINTKNKINIKNVWFVLYRQNETNKNKKTNIKYE